MVPCSITSCIGITDVVAGRLKMSRICGDGSPIVAAAPVASMAVPVLTTPHEVSVSSAHATISEGLMLRRSYEVVPTYAG